MAKADRQPSKRRKGEIPLRILVDTCVWLDIAKDYRQKTLLGALEELASVGKVELGIRHQPRSCSTGSSRTFWRISSSSLSGPRSLAACQRPSQRSTELFDKAWYNRHWNTRIAIEEGHTKIVEKETFPVKDHTKRPIQRDVWELALKAAKHVEETRQA
jgi:hypothetical protein